MSDRAAMRLFYVFSVIALALLLAMGVLPWLECRAAGGVLMREPFWFWACYDPASLRELPQRSRNP